MSSSTWKRSRTRSENRLSNTVLLADVSSKREKPGGMKWQVIDGPHDRQPGVDALMAFERTIESERVRRTVLVELHADLAGAESMSEESEVAVSLRGRSAFERFLDEEAPPTRSVIHADRVEVV